MKTFIHFLVLGIFLLLNQTTQAADGECVIVIQGVRDTTPPADPNEAFISNTADAFIRGMGNFPGPPNITAIRPQGDAGQLGGQPPHTAQSYSSKADLLAKIKAALCAAECKNVVLAFIGHGMGGEGIRQAPPNANAGGMMVKSGGGNNAGNEFITAEEIAKIIDECQKSVKLVACTCYSEAMVNGIKDKLKNKHLIGVGVSASGWNEEAEAHGGSTGTIIYDFMLYFLQDYYLILGNPNLMEELKAKAAELKKKNEETNEKIKAENAAAAQKIKEAEAELKAMNAQAEKLAKDIEKAKTDKANAQTALDLLKARAQLEKDLQAAIDNKDKAEKKRLEDELKKNKDDLKKAGYDTSKLPTLTEPKNRAKELEKKQIPNQEKVVQSLADALTALEKELAALKKKIIDKEFALEELKNTPPKALIPNHEGLMELVIHEAFKSAQAKTPATSGHPKEPVPPAVASNPNAPNQPLTKVKVGNYYVHFYKVINKKTNECVVVGYWANAQGTPIQLLKSYKCDIECKNAKFSLTDNGVEKIIEATLQPDGKYKFTLGGQDATSQYISHKASLILPGSLIEEVYFKVVFNQITEVTVPKGQVSNVVYNANTKTLTFTLVKNNVTYQVSIMFLPHGVVKVQINGGAPYFASQVRHYTLLDQAKHPYGELAIIENPIIVGTALLTNLPNPMPVSGSFSSDGIRFMVQNNNPSMPLNVQPLNGSSDLMQWIHSGKTGILQPDIQVEPDLTNVFLNPLNDGRNALAWLYNTAFLNEYDQNQWLGTRIIKYNLANQVIQVFDVPKSNNTFVDPDNSGNPNFHYQVQSNSKNDAYCVPYESPFFDEYGRPTVVSLQQGNTRVGIQEIEPQLMQNTPNPFAFTTEVGFVIPQNDEVSLSIYTMTGELVKRINGYYPKGYNQVSINRKDLRTPGVYLYMIQTPTFTRTRKMILLHE